MRVAGYAELLLVPQVHSGLVADLDRDGQVSEDLAPGPDHRVFSVPGQVGAVEVGEVIVENACLGWLAGDHVPDGLIEAPGAQVPSGQAHPRGPGCDPPHRVVPSSA